MIIWRKTHRAGRRRKSVPLNTCVSAGGRMCVCVRVFIARTYVWLWNECVDARRYIYFVFLVARVSISPTSPSFIGRWRARWIFPVVTCLRLCITHVRHGVRLLQLWSHVPFSPHLPHSHSTTTTTKMKRSRKREANIAKMLSANGRMVCVRINKEQTTETM